MAYLHSTTHVGCGRALPETTPKVLAASVCGIKQTLIVYLHALNHENGDHALPKQHQNY